MTSLLNGPLNNIDPWSLFFYGTGLILFLVRRFPRNKRLKSPLQPLTQIQPQNPSRAQVPPSVDLKELAIIVPARNEEENLPLLLESLKTFRDHGAHIVVADDQSTDKTALLAKNGGAHVCPVTLRPETWSGKNWACHSGFEYLKTLADFDSIKYILFTDADTIQNLAAFESALSVFKEEKIGLLTARPYHRNPKFWQQCLGPFYQLLYFVTHAHQSQPSSKRFFSIGQFLLFEKTFYQRIKGHSSVQNRLAEDLALAQLCFSNHQRFYVYPDTNLYQSCMYSRLIDFIRGWHRNFRLGMKDSAPLTSLETVWLIGAIMGQWNLPHYLFISFFMMTLQKKAGRFHPLGAFLYPLSVGLFIGISFSAVISNALQKPLLWKSREYKT